MIYKLILGDWSDDGHGISKDILFDCNYPVKDIQEAYKNSCKKFGIQFDYNENYIGDSISYGDDRLVWTEYEENDISSFAYKILVKNHCLDNIVVEKLDTGRYYVESINDCGRVIMNFIALSMPDDFTYTVVEEDYPCINGYWDENLNAQFGYGLFDN